MIKSTLTSLHCARHFQKNKPMGKPATSSCIFVVCLVCVGKVLEKAHQNRSSNGASLGENGIFRLPFRNVLRQRLQKVLEAALKNRSSNDIIGT